MKHTLTVNREVTVTKIAITGQMRSGKDSAADHMRFYYGFNKFAFGNALKRTAHEVFPWITSESKPRRLYQKYGQTMRMLDKNVWVAHVERQIGHSVDYHVGQGESNIGIVISDLRQQNEYEWARANGFTIIRVTAPDELRIERAKKAGDDFSDTDLTHETEQAIGGFVVDYEIVNDGTVEELLAKVESVMAELTR